MKRFLVCVLLTLSAGLFAEVSAPALPAQNLQQLDGAFEGLSDRIYARLAGLPQSAIVQVEDFLVDGNLTSLGNYVRNQLLSNLSAKKDRTYILNNLSGPRSAYSLSGEILALGQTVRVYVRFGGRADNAILAVWVLDLAHSPFLGETLAGDFPPQGAVTRRDSYEDDSIEEPVEIAAEIRLSRTLHNGDNDWFVFRPERGGYFRAETMGEIDTLMTLYEGDSRSVIEEDDDSGDNANAVIEFTAEEGASYFFKVSGYGSASGSYYFRVKSVN